jgi:hypothetical protein
MDDPFSNMRDPVMRADRYQRLAWQYFDLAKEASSRRPCALTFNAPPKTTGCGHRAN